MKTAYDNKTFAEAIESGHVNGQLVDGTFVSVWISHSGEYSGCIRIASFTITPEDEFTFTGYDADILTYNKEDVMIIPSGECIIIKTDAYPKEHYGLMIRETAYQNMMQKCLGGQTIEFINPGTTEPLPEGFKLNPEDVVNVRVRALDKNGRPVNDSLN